MCKMYSIANMITVIGKIFFIGANVDTVLRYFGDKSKIKKVKMKEDFWLWLNICNQKVTIDNF